MATPDNITPGVPTGAMPAPLAPPPNAPTPGVPTGAIPSTLTTQAQPKTGLFEGILHAMVPKRTITTPDPNDPTNFIRTEVPTSRGTLAQHLFAGVLSGIMAGAKSQSGPTPEGASQYSAPMRSAAAGFEAGQKSQQDFANAPQQKYEDAKTKAAAIAKTNIDTHHAMINNSMLDDQYRQAAIDKVKPISDAIDDYELKNPAKDPSQSLVLERGITADQAMAKGEKVLLNYNAIIDGQRPTGKKNSDGTDQWEYTYKIINPYAQIAYDEKLKQLGVEAGYPNMQKASDNLVTDAKMLVYFQNRLVDQQNALGAVDKMLQNGYKMDHDGSIEGYEMPKLNPRDLVNGVDDPLEQNKDLRTIGATAGMSPIAAYKWLAGDQKNGPRVNERTLANWERLTGFDEDKATEWAQQRKKEIAQDANLEYQKQLQYQKPFTLDSAMSTINDIDAPPIRRQQAQAFIDTNQLVKSNLARMRTRAEQDEKTGNSEDAARLLYENKITLSQLKSRGTTPKFITEVVDKANAMALAQGNPQWSAETGESFFKNASAPQNNQFFGSANSLLDPKYGTIAKLKAAHQALGDTGIPVLNDWKQYLQWQAGDPSLSKARQVLIGVADDYAKVMGGGVGSDTSRIQVMQTFAQAQNDAQFDAASEGAYEAVKSQVRSRIGENPQLGVMYGSHVQDMGLPHNPTAPQHGGAPHQGGAERPVKQNGQIIGYTTDGIHMRPVHPIPAGNQPFTIPTPMK